MTTDFMVAGLSRCLWRPLERHIHHNDVFHVVQMLGLAPLYCGDLNPDNAS